PGRPRACTTTRIAAPRNGKPRTRAGFVGARALGRRAAVRDGGRAPPARDAPGGGPRPRVAIRQTGCGAREEIAHRTCARPRRHRCASRDTERAVGSAAVEIAAADDGRYVDAAKARCPGERQACELARLRMPLLPAVDRADRGTDHD